MAHNGPGYRIVDLWEKRGRESGCRWEVQVWRPSVSRYAYHAKDGDYAAVEHWAKNEAATRRVNRNFDVTVTLKTVGAEYVALLEDGNRAEAHRKQVERVIALFVAAGLEDLQASDFFLRARAAWKAMKIKGGSSAALHRWCMRYLWAHGTSEAADVLAYIQEKMPRPADEKPIHHNTVLSGLQRLAKRGQARMVESPGQRLQFAAVATEKAYEAALPKLSPVTMNSFMKTLVAVIDYAVGEGKIPRNPLSQIIYETEDSALRPAFTIAELEQLVAPNSHPYRLTACLMIYTGCRTGEARHLRWEDIDWAAMRISVRIQAEYRLKRRKERRVKLMDELAGILKPIAAALTAANPFAKLTGWIIADAALREANEKSDWTRFRAYCVTRGVEPGRRSRHATRRSWVSLKLATGDDFYFVKLEAGHEKTETTEKYAGSAEDFRDQVASWPKAQFRLLAAAAPAGVQPAHLGTGVA